MAENGGLNFYDEEFPSCSERYVGLNFQYEWLVKVCKRPIGNGEYAILNVSPAFSTAYNGVQFTWTLRLNADCLAHDYLDGGSNSVNVFLYYKDGPAQDISIFDAKFTVMDKEGEIVFSNLKIPESEWTRGSGWPAVTTAEEHCTLSTFMNENVDSLIRIAVNIRMPAAVFSPLHYFPQFDGACARLENACSKYLRDVKMDTSVVPDLDLILESPDFFAVHRLIFTYGCSELERNMKSFYDKKKIHNVFAHIYFTECIMHSVEGFNDFVRVIEGLRFHNITDLLREAERFICRKLISCRKDTGTVKKMLLLAERYQMPVLKMMCAGIIADHIIEYTDSARRFDVITKEMKLIAKQIDLDDVFSDANKNNDLLVESVVEELKLLAKRIRRVSVSRSSSTTSTKSSRSSSPLSHSPDLSLNVT